MIPLPFVTIALPCRNEERHVEACLRSVLAQDYPKDRLEVMIADGRSADRTRAIVLRMVAEDPRIQLLDNPGLLQAAAMNEIIRRARGDVIVRMDVHCVYASDYVRRCAETLERTGAKNVGGAQRARPTTAFQRALCAALRSPLGVGGARYRSEEEEGFVDTVFLGAFRREVFEEVGLYDPDAVPNEDAELNQRILDAGGRVYLSRDIVVHYSPRDSAGKLAVQYFRYGKARARTLLKHRRLPTLRPTVPFLALLAGVALVAAPMLRPAAPWALALYAAVGLAEAVRVGRTLGAAGVASVWAIFPLLHAAHGAGFAVGLAHHARRQDWGEPERLARPEPASPRVEAAPARLEKAG